MSTTRITRRTTFVSALAGASALAVALTGCAPAAEPTNVGPLTLNIGTALPQTGNLAFLGPGMEAGVELAVTDINAADKGITIELTRGDSGDTDNKAYETEIPRLLDAGVSAIIGAASSGTSLQFIDQVTGAGVIQFSPANTSATFSDYDDNGLYFRTAPSDVLQGDVLGNLIGGVQSGMGYLGAANLGELRSKARYIRVSPAGQKEAAPHDVIEVSTRTSNT